MRCLRRFLAVRARRRGGRGARAIVVVALGACAIVVAGAGCGHGVPQGTAMPVQVDRNADATVGPDDVFEVRVFGEAELTAEYRVAPDGTIDFPMVGRVTVEGMSSSAIQAEMTRRLAEGYIRNPQVTVTVKQWNSRRISVLGQVKNPGYINYTTSMTIVDAIVAAGGFTPTADKNAVRLRQERNGNVVTSMHRVGDMTEGRLQPAPVFPRDVIVVEERLF